MGESLQPPPGHLQDSDPLPCPNCGYDLRANLAEKCSECGQTIDRATLGISNFPWVHRRHAGRIRTYWKTVWLITIDSRRLKFETWKNQNLDDARFFQRWTAFIVALTLSACCVAVLIDNPNLFALPIPAPRLATWTDDLLLPWLAGANLIPVLPAMLFLLGIHLTTIHQRLFRAKSAFVPMQERARAIARYATAPLASLLPLAVFCGALNLMLPGTFRNNILLMAIAILASLFAVLLVPLTLLRILQRILRVRNLGLEYSLLIAPRLIGLWLFVLLLDLGILPWCIGLVYLAIDSSR